MKLSNTPPSKRTAPDQDLAEQARPGHGIPSQDPEIGAQVSLEPWEAEREANSVLTGGGMMVGAAAGAAIGSVVAGPVGAVVGGTAGAVAGVLGGGAAGNMVSPEDEATVDAAPEKKRPVEPAVKPARSPS